MTEPTTPPPGGQPTGPADPDCAWIITDLASDGTYMVTVQVNQDLSIPLDHAAGIRYAAAVVQAAQRARYDAAAYAQLTRGVSMPVKLALESLGLLRGDRPPADSAATSPVDLRTGLTAAGKPFIGMWLAGKQIGQLDVDAAMEHATGILAAVEVAALDNAYYQFLQTMACSEQRARGMVADLSRWDYEEPAQGGEPA